MQTFQGFREWAGGARAGERAGTAVAAVLLVALVGWLLVPHQPDVVETTAGVDAGAAADTAAGGPAAPAPDAGDIAAGPGIDTPGAATDIARATDAGSGVQPGGAAADAAPGPAPTPGAPLAAAGGDPSAPAGGCVSPPGTARGVTAKEIQVAVGLSEIAGPAAGSLFGIPPAAQQQADFEAVIADINRGGGVACRKVVARYYKVNPVDQAQMQRQCLEIAASGAYAVIDTGPFAAVTTAPLACFAQNKVSYFGAYFIPEFQAQELYPYLFSFSTFEGLLRHTATGLKDLGFFSSASGFKKLGFLYRNCQPQLVETYRTALRRAGVTDDQVVGYDLGCPSAFASPADITQAVLKFKQAGVTHVTTARAVGDFATFTDVAEQQGFRPKYGLPDEGLVQISYGNQRPNPQNLAGAVTITASSNAEDRTPGNVPSPGTVRCNAIYAARKLPSAYDEPALAGNVCSQLWMFEAAVEHAPSVSQADLGTGLMRAKSVEFSFPQGPNDFTKERTTTGGQFWRAAEYRSSCQCWQLQFRDFRRSPG